MADPEGSRLRFTVSRPALFAAEESVQMRFSADGERFSHDVENGPAWRLEAAGYLELCINKPTAIFGGLKRQNFVEGFCYATTIAGNRTGFVLVAFAVVDSGEMFFTDWAFRVQDPRKPGFPINSRTDFGATIWPK